MSSLVSFCLLESHYVSLSLIMRKRDRERLSRVILNLDMFSEVICNQITEDAYLPRVVCTVFGFGR